MLAIRKLQEERDLWEAEREQMEEKHASELARLQSEVANLRNNQTPAVVQMSEPVRADHEQQVKLIQTIDNLRRELQREQDNKKLLERRLASEGEDSRWISPSAPSGGGLDATRGGIDATMARAQMPAPPPEDFASLEDENLMLREELNAAKEKVIELKKAAAKRRQEWNDEIQQITEELNAKQKLEAEAAGLRADRTRLQQELFQQRQQFEADQRGMGNRDSATKAEMERLRSELQQAHEDIAKANTEADEFKKLSETFNRRVQEMEKELSDMMHKNSRLLELFLQHTERPLEAIRRGCQQLVSRASCDLPPEVELPSRWIPNPNDLQNCLVELVTMLRYGEAVLEAVEEKWFPRQRTHAGGYPGHRT